MNPNPGYARIANATYKSLRNFMDVVPGSIKHHLNTEELFRIAITAVTSGGGFFGFLQLVLTSAGAIFLSPADASFAVAILTMVLETHRRLGQGGIASVPRPAGTRPEIPQSSN